MTNFTFSLNMTQLQENRRQKIDENENTFACLFFAAARFAFWLPLCLFLSGKTAI
jgi:hypothetical protein